MYELKPTRIFLEVALKLYTWIESFDGFAFVGTLGHGDPQDDAVFSLLVACLVFMV